MSKQVMEWLLGDLIQWILSLKYTADVFNQDSNWVGLYESYTIVP